MSLRLLQTEDVRDWFLEDGPVTAVQRASCGIGTKGVSKAKLNELLGLPASVSFALRHYLDEVPDADETSFESLPFYSLCYGFFLPLMGIATERIPKLFGLPSPPNWSPEKKLTLVKKLLSSEIGLSLSEKTGLVFGDPFLGRAPAVRHDTLVNVLSRLVFQPVATLREELIRAGDLPSLFAMSTEKKKSDPPLASAVVCRALRYLRQGKRREREEALFDLFSRAGRMERYVLAALILGKVHLSLPSRIEPVLEALSEQYKAKKEALGSAAALLDIFGLCDLLETEGLEGLKNVTLKPLSPIRPALAGATIPKHMKYPVWFECKYDGLRLMLHKETDSRGQILAGAFTRRRHDWLELIKGVDTLARMLPCRSVILDGELHGTVLDAWGTPRPATVYQVHNYLRGMSPTPVNLKYVAFDIIYLNGHDLTQQAFRTRRQNLETLLAPFREMPLPLPITISHGSLAESKEQLNRLYEQYRSQGHEGGMAKLEDSTYPIAQRTMSWMKRKPEETLDLVLTAAFWNDPTAAGQRPFDSFSISCRTPEGFREVGQVAGVDSATSIRVCQTIMSQGLLTGRTVEHRGSTHTSSGVELAPGLVVSVRFEGLVRPDPERLALRSPRIDRVRIGEIGPQEASTWEDLMELHLKQGLG